MRGSAGAPIRITPPAASAPALMMSIASSTSAGVRRWPRRGHSGRVLRRARTAPRSWLSSSSNTSVHASSSRLARQLLQAAVHALTDDLLRALQASRDLAVALLLDQPCEQRGARVLRELGESSLKAALTAAGTLLHALECGIVERDLLHPQPSPSPVRDAVAAQALAQLVASDPEQPRDRGSVLVVGARAHDDRGESLRRQIERELAIADTALKERHDRIEMPAIERRERILIPRRDSPQQTHLIIPRRTHHPYRCASVSICDRPGGMEVGSDEGSRPGLRFSPERTPRPGPVPAPARGWLDHLRSAPCGPYTRRLAESRACFVWLMHGMARVIADEVVSHAFSHGLDPDHAERLASYSGRRRLAGPRRFRPLYGDQSAVVRMPAATAPTRKSTAARSRAFRSGAERRRLCAGQPTCAGLHDYFAWATTTTMARCHDSADDVPKGLQRPAMVMGPGRA